MKAIKNIKKILFVGKENIALVVFNTINSKMNILFASQIPTNPVDLKVNLNQLFTNAANFLDFTIKDVELVIVDANIEKKRYINENFADCHTKEEVIKEIYKKAKINNRYVNEIFFNDFKFDEIDKKAIVSCEICHTEYLTYKNYLKTIEQCHVQVVSVTNLYSLVNNNSNGKNVVLTFNNDSVIACKFIDKKLFDIKNIKIDYENLINCLSKQFNLDALRTKHMITLASKLIDTDFRNVNVGLSFDYITKTFNEVKTSNFIYAYRDLLRQQLSKEIDLSGFTSVFVCSNDKINNFDRNENLNFDIVGLENIDIEKILALNNTNQATKNLMTHFEFENKINNMLHLNKKNIFMI